MAEERDKAKLQKELFLKKLEEMPVVSAVCNKTNVPKANVYRWKAEDPEFKGKFDEIIKKGVDNINDLADCKLIQKIQEGNMGAIRFWLSNRHPAYVKEAQRRNLIELPEPFSISISTVKSRDRRTKKGLNT